ncbi:MAG TPA: DJ-1/PfpI family protein [Thermoanaerobaculia bacterium]
MTHYRVGIPLYAGFDLIDVTSVWDTFNRIQDYWKDGTIEVLLLGAACTPIQSGQRLTLTPTATFEEKINVLITPGAQDVSQGLADQALLKFLRAQADIEWVTSVCTGAVVNSAAGLLDGYEATTHWAAIDKLKANPKVKVVNGCPRYVRDRNRFTTAGVSASLDGAFELMSILTSEQVAKCVQLIVQYNPQPPFAGGDPCTADYATYALVMGG